jgi:hypothetical protein
LCHFGYIHSFSNYLHLTCLQLPPFDMSPSNYSKFTPFTISSSSLLQW